MPRTLDYAETEFEEPMEFFDEIEAADMETGVNGEAGEPEWELEDSREASDLIDPALIHPQLGIGIPVESEVESEDQEEEIIGKADSRSPIRNTTKIPYRYICRLTMTYQDPAVNGGKKIQYAGTGTLISPRHILTAGHNVCTKFGGKILNAKSVKAAPGQDRGDQPFNEYNVTGFKAKNEWTNDQNACHDYALLTLEKDIGGLRFKSIGNKPFGYWGDFLPGNNTRVEFIDPTKLKKAKLWVAGYAGDKCGYIPIQPHRRGDLCKYAVSGTASKELVACFKAKLHATAQFGDKGRMVDPLPPGGGSFLFFYDADTCRGHSGSPVWTENGGMRYLLGVHTGSMSLKKGTCLDPLPAGQNPDINRAVRLTTNVLDNIHKWMS